VREQLSTREVAQLVGRSASSIRTPIERGELKAERLPGVGYRIPRSAVLALAGEVLRDEAGARLSDAQVRKLVEQVLEHNEAATG
jgi:excisionase family DNA binding protein